jgi:hypothetical protein
MKTREQLQADYDTRRRQSETDRRKYDPGCSTCEDVKKSNGFGPSHDASPRCRSGFYEHCSCDTCF